MKNPVPIRRPAKPSEQGYVLLAVIFLLALLTIALAVAAPKVAKQIQRDRELETMHRGKQYIRAIKMYYKKFGSYPPNADALYKPTNNIRFLRKKYADPTTGKEDWKPIFYGQNKAPTAMGFFGQPLGGVGTGGCVGSNPLGGSSNSLSSASTSGSSFGSSAGSNSNCLGTGLASPGATPPTDPNAPVDPNAANSSGAAGSTTGQTGQAGQTFGGVGIIGFSPNSPKQSIMVYKKKNHYNEWEFVYDPQAEQLMQMSGAVSTGPNGQPLGGGLGNNTGFGNNTGTGNAGGFSNNSGVGGSASSTIPTPSSPTPQQ